MGAAPGAKAKYVGLVGLGKGSALLWLLPQALHGPPASVGASNQLSLLESLQAGIEVVPEGGRVASWHTGGNSGKCMPSLCCAGDVVQTASSGCDWQGGYFEEGSHVMGPFMKRPPYPH